MNNAHPSRPGLFLYFFRLFALLGAVPFLINTVDILLHLSAPALGSAADPGKRLLMGLLLAPLTLAVAMLCIRRAPGNLIGWLLVVFSYGISVEAMRADLLPLELGVLIANFVIGLFWFSFLLIPLYFPDGQLYPPRANRWGNPLVSFVLFFSLVVANLSNRQLTWGTELAVPNPLLVFEWNYTAVTIPMILALLVAGILIVILRYRGSRELERLQLRWLLFGVLFQGGLTVLMFWTPPGLERISNWVSLLYYLIIPVAVGIAVLRYRLYEIDLIIRRTLQYGLLTVLLGLVYFGMVVLLEQAFRSLTGQDSPLAVVLSTLVIAGLFNPLRRRIQIVIDRRFFRAKYNADQAVASFSAAARNEVELESLTRHLTAAAQQSLQPEGVWVWIRKDVIHENIRSEE